MVKFAENLPLDSFFERVGPGVSKSVSVAIIEGHGIVQIFAANSKSAAVEKALKIKGTPGVATKSRSYTAIPLSPGQWMMISGEKGPDGFAEQIRSKIKKNGYVSEQSDGRVIFRITGSRARELMQKRLPFGPGSLGCIRGMVRTDTDGAGRCHNSPTG